MEENDPQGRSTQSLRPRRLGLERLESRRMMAAYDVLVFWEGSTHTSTDYGIAAIQALGATHNFTVTDTNDSAAFTAANLRNTKP